MPIKDFKNLFWIVDAETGEKHKMGHIENVELTASDSQEAEPYINLKPMESFSAEVKTHGSVINKVLVMIGAKSFVPNNWLKHHGFPMNRRK